MVHLEVPEKYSPISYYFVPPAPRVKTNRTLVPEVAKGKPGRF